MLSDSRFGAVIEAAKRIVSYKVAVQLCDGPRYTRTVGQPEARRYGALRHAGVHNQQFHQHGLCISVYA